MATLNIAKVNSLPLTYEANTLYMVKGSAATALEIYLSDSTGASLRHVSTTNDVLDQTIIMSDTTPSTDTHTRFWWHTGTASLYILYDDGTNKNWIEAVPALSIPEFAGNGTELTMAHSDHWHESITLSEAAW